jgi:hypothetical protein
MIDHKNISNTNMIDNNNNIISNNNNIDNNK